jgi:hypothetical protein
MLFAHMLVVAHVHVAVETLQLMLPFGVQLFTTAAKPLLLLSGGVLQGMKGRQALSWIVRQA